jgi:hypothetical protein
MAAERGDAERLRESMAVLETVSHPALRADQPSCAGI